ncbi:NADAR family protein [Micromonospora sp. WMMD882]|uniref:NADAR family protein n=1 Tax=Micromonospora sp. WMMD882 TaxID=3015151 RepID=UPI00248BB773|nr:NADAR family protein [Micromonospora sp. WMMD882]WBB81013.1 NADAR family protein [Micromonospora sp. WMMD882]
MRPTDVLPSSVEEARRREAAGVPMRFLFFWGHRPGRGGGVGRGCLSQWWPAPFTVDGLEFPTAEHFMMRHKALLFGDEEVADQILTTPDPGAVKALGRRVRGFDEAVWQTHRYAIVVAGNTAKFGQRPELRDYLLGTGEQILVEASPLDRVWGIGLTADDERATSPARWRGLNLLGFALMDARAALRAS